MKSLRLACVGLTLSLLTQSMGLADCSCGQCCKSRNDRGLLDIMDQAFSGLLANSKKALTRKSCDTGRHCDCQEQPSCGCESEPNCGCEYEPNCGCEHKPGCDSGCSCSQAFRGQPPIITPQQQVWPVAPYQPPVQQHMAPRPTPRPQVPAPVPVPSLPDSKVDPFRDDAVNRVRRAPARTIQYRSSKPSYSDRYDPQAGNHTQRQSTDDTRTRSPSLSQASVDGQHFGSESSSRIRPYYVSEGLVPEGVVPEGLVPAARTPAARVLEARTFDSRVYSNQQLEGHQVEVPITPASGPRVVPASGLLPQRVPSLNAKRLSDYEPQTDLNPLRP